MMPSPPPEDFFPIVVRCPGCSKRRKALAPLAWPARVPMPARCCSCRSWLKVDLSSPSTSPSAATTTTAEAWAKATEGTAKVGPEALVVEWPSLAVLELAEEK